MNEVNEVVATATTVAEKANNSSSLLLLSMLLTMGAITSTCMFLLGSIKDNREYGFIRTCVKVGFWISCILSLACIIATILVASPF